MTISLFSNASKTTSNFTAIHDSLYKPLSLSKNFCGLFKLYAPINFSLLPVNSLISSLAIINASSVFVSPLYKLLATIQLSSFFTYMFPLVFISSSPKTGFI